MVVANPLRARPASPPLKRRAGALVSVVGVLRRGAHKQKPRQGDGAKSGHVSCHTGLADPSRTQAHHPNAQPHRWLHTKAPPGAGLSWSRLSDGACRRGAKSSAASRHPNAEPQSWLHSAQGETLAEKAPPSSGAKVPSEGLAVCDNGKPTETIPQSVAQRAGMT